MATSALKIVALGGGELRSHQTLPIDREIVAWTGVQRPRALFIPTASNDSDGYCQAFRAVYGQLLGCAVETLALLADQPSPSSIRERIERADLVYVGGGNTRSMLEEWRRQGVDRLLLAAAERGTVLCGVSAGALCWFRHGNSDAPLLEGATGERTMRVDGLGLVDAALCPHFASEAFRRDEFTRMMAETAGIGLALDDSCAVQIHGHRFRILATDDTGRAHRFYRAAGRVRSAEIEPSPAYRPLAELWAPLLP